MRRLVVSSAAALVLCLALAAPAAAWTWPLHGQVLRPFVLGADAYAGGQHRGIDVAGSAGEDVLAPAAGTVSFVGTVPTHGRTITIHTTEGLAVTLTHVGVVRTARGAVVAEGAVIGTAGASGTSEHPVPYVHLGVRVAAEDHGYLDPARFLPPRAASPPPASPTPATPEPVSAPSPAPSAGGGTPGTGGAPGEVGPGAGESVSPSSGDTPTSAALPGVTLSPGAGSVASPAVDGEATGVQPSASLGVRGSTAGAMGSGTTGSAIPRAPLGFSGAAASGATVARLLGGADGSGGSSSRAPSRSAAAARADRPGPGAEGARPTGPGGGDRRSPGPRPLGADSHAGAATAHDRPVALEGRGALGASYRGAGGIRPNGARSPLTPIGLGRLTAAVVGGLGLLVFAALVGQAVAVAGATRRRPGRRIGVDGALLRHDADLLRQLDAAHRPCLHDDRGRRVRAASAPAWA